MPESKKPNRATGYDSRHVDHVRAACLCVATKLGDLIDETVIIGGLAPSLLVDQPRIQSAEDRHVGTMGLDVGVSPDRDNAGREHLVLLWFVHGAGSRGSAES
jgi:hypothetical protein